MFKKQVEIIMRGEVQGVTFRYYGREKAKLLGLSGWIKNEDDGTVKIIAQGKEKELKKFIEWCKKGPEFAEVEGIQIKWQEPKGEFNEFKIEY